MPSALKDYRSMASTRPSIYTTRELVQKLFDNRHDQYVVDFYLKELFLLYGHVVTTKSL